MCVCFFFIRVQEEEKVILVRSNDGHAHEILHHQTEEGEKRIEEKGRSTGSAGLLSHCASEERIERCCVYSHSLRLVSSSFYIERGASVFSLSSATTPCRLR